ncbi:MAG: beta-ketoacyl-ACP synthase II [Deltaproteobacteria bacterium]|nr:beta-ketoacyl-ACP synthase II [Deltaproteobacteria bacterium]MBW2419950.1 beta-ketoacyl-ACP synthase II [Deltaproteobacteria bacterium]
MSSTEKDPSRRIVVTGMGAVTPLGLDVASTWESAVAGRSGAGPLDRFDASRLTVQLAAQLPGVPEVDVPVKEARRFDPVVRYGLAASAEALRDSGLELSDDNRTGIGVSIGSGIGGIGTIIENHDILRESGPRRVSPFTIPMGIANMPSGYVSIHYGLGGPNLCHVSACASGAHAIGECAELIARGQAKVMLAGGVDAAILGVTVAGFAAMKALSTRNDEPERASRPFDRDRDGFVLGEGAGVLVLESLAHARARGARVRAEILGYGADADGSQMVAPDPAGTGAARCMRLALEQAGLEPSRIDHVNAHATSTPTGDPCEVRALEQVFGKHLQQLPVSATKSMTGHLLGAAGAVEGILTIRALEEGLLPPTINLEHPDPECQLDHVANKARRSPIRTALSNSFGFGGTNCSVIFGRVDD